MIKKVLLTLLFLPFLSAYGQPDADKLRNDFFAIAKDSCGVQALFESIKNDSYNTALLQAYAGATEAASAQCVKGAFNKLEYFSRGKKNIEAAIEKSPQNAEIRFLRFATQCNAPNFLEYDNIKKDKSFIIDQLPDMLKKGGAVDFWKNVADFMINSGKLTNNEIGVLTDLLKN